MTDEDIVRVDDMCQRSTDLAAVVTKIKRHLHRTLRHRNKKDILETLVYGFSLRIRLPLLKERRERVAIDNLPTHTVAHRDLTVPLHRKLSEALTLAIPARRLTELIHGDVLLMVIAREDVVNAQGLVLKPTVEVLRTDAQC